MLPLVEQLAETWASVSDLCADLTEDEWKTPTGCPGWSVQDNVSHLIDFESYALGRPRPDHTIGDLPHLKNDMGKINEVGVDARRSRTGAEVLAEFREVTAERLQRLAALTDDDLARETPTPVGPGTVGDLLTLRVMDTWSHEQDIRRALGRPGHATGPAPTTAIEYLSRFLGFAVAKKAAAPEGTTVRFEIGDTAPLGVEVSEGRGVITTPPGDPTVALRMDGPTFSALTGGRDDAPTDAVTVDGDTELGRRILAGLAFLP